MKCDWIFSSTTIHEPCIEEKPMNSIASISCPIGSNQNRPFAWLLACPLAIAILCSHLQVHGESASEDGWRRTSRGWEYAHAVQIVPESLRAKKNNSLGLAKAPSSRTPTRSVRKSPWFVWQSYALPLATGTFFVSFGWWLLVDVPNNAIVRRL